MKYNARLQEEAKLLAKAIRAFDKDHPELTLDEAVDVFRFKGETVSRETYRKHRNAGRANLPL